MELSEWIVIDGYCATRVKLGTDPNNVENRIAFIEKTPSVRVPHSQSAISTKNRVGATGLEDNQTVWIQGYYNDSTVSSPNFRNNREMCAIQARNNDRCEGDYGFDALSRTWCDDMLKLLGYTLK